MFSGRKRIFAGKQNLQPEPFCPIISNQSGYLSLYQSSNYHQFRPSHINEPRPTARDGKHRV